MLTSSLVTLNTSVVGSGSITRNPDQTVYSQGSSVTLTAVPVSGYAFSGWSGDASGSTNPLVVTMNTNKSITATFALAPTLTRYEQSNVYLAYLGTWSSGSGSSYSGASYKYANKSGASVTATFVGTAVTYIAKTATNFGIARVTLDGGTVALVTLYSSTSKYKQAVWSASGLAPTGTHTLVIEWTGTSNGSGKTINVDALDILGTLVPATPPTTVTLSTSVVGSGSITRNPNQTTFNQGDSVTLTAVPASGYTFSGWSGDASGSTNPLLVTMNANKSITATFVPTSTTVTLSTAVVGSGSITRNPNQTTFNQGDSVTLTAVPASGYTFSGWSGDASGSTNPLLVTMNANKSITATFVPTSTTVTLSTAVVGSGSITRNPNQTTFNQGDSVTLTAVPASGYTFSGWSGDASGSTNPLLVTMNANKSITATFVVTQTATRYEQTDPYLVYSGIWSLGMGSSYSGGSYKYTSKLGASVTATFNGTAISYIAKIATNFGMVRITLDDEAPVLVSLRNGSALYRQVVWSASGLTPGVHTLVIDCPGLNGGGSATTINLDALDIVGTLIPTS